MRALALAFSVLMLASSWTPAQAQEPPMLGASLAPTLLSLPSSETAVSAHIQNLGNVPVTVTAAAFLSPSLEAPGWSVTVEPTSLEPNEWATVTLKQRRLTPLANVSLDILMGPQTRAGMDSTSLRFPVPVTVEGATPESTVRAWVTALMRTWMPRLWATA